MSSTYDRYEIKEIVGEGGMGIVYRAVDLEMQSDVALKTIKELLDPLQLELFRRECSVLRKLRHPNVVDLYDFGVTEDKGQQKPFFVMPFLPGSTLDKLIVSHTARLTPERVVDIITQTARGLHAAHLLGLVHRDIKPSNIFVLGDDSVKIIDFGVVHLTDQHSRTGFKGTLPYMSPEQLELNPPTAVSDVFSLAVVCYEALTRRRPFQGSTEAEIRDSILQTTPPPISELNPAVSLALSQVVHAAMAKQPWHRTSTARQFAEELQKALHGQTIERLDPSRIEPRIDRAQRALEASEYDFAAEILNEIEAEGHINPTIRSLRRQIDQALRARAAKEALKSAQHRFVENEYQLALQKIDEVLRLDPGNSQALALKDEIGNKQRTNQLENWFRLAHDHIQNYGYNHARQALQNVLRLEPTNTMAIQMLSEVDRREGEYLREHREKEQLYKSALEAWHRGEVSVALTKLERVLELDRRAPDSASSESAVSYQNLYNQVRSERDRIKNAYDETRKLLSEDDFAGASSICEQVLTQYPDQPLFQALKFDIGERQRQYVSAHIVKIDRDVEAEPDLDRKVAILSEATARYPEEAHFRERLDRVSKRRDLVASITERIGNLEERGQYAEALSQLETLRAIYPQYPGLDLDVDRISKRRDQQAMADGKARWINQIDGALTTGDFSHALDLLKSALTDMQGDAELLAQERLARDGLERSREAARVFERAQALCAQDDLKGGLDLLFEAQRLDVYNPLIRAVLVETLLKTATSEMDRDPARSEQLVSRAFELDPGNTSAGNLRRMVQDRQRDKAVDSILSKSRDMQAAGDPNAALSIIQRGLDSYSDERRLHARKEALLKVVNPAPSQEEREGDLKEMRELHNRMEQARDEAAFNTIMARSRVIAGKYIGDRDVESVFRSVEDQWLKTNLPSIHPVQVEVKREKVERAAEATVPTSPVSKETTHDRSRRLSETLGAAAIRVKHRLQSSGSAVRAMPKKHLAAIAAVPILIVLVGWIAAGSLDSPPPPPPPPPLATVEVKASIAGARLLVNGEDRGANPVTLELEAGDYKFDATLPGYAAKPVELRIERGDKQTVTVPLEARPPIFRVSTEFLQASLDNEKLTLDGTGFERTGLAPGLHVLQLSNPVAGTITVEFEMIEGQAPAVRKVESSRTLVVALATLADRGQLYSSLRTLKVGVNGPAAAEVGEQAMPVTLSPGRNEFAFDDSRNTINVALNADDPNPSLNIIVGAQPNSGNLEITETGKIEATVSVEPTDKKGPVRTGKLTNGRYVFRLRPTTYLVEISANGYTLEKKSVTVKKGDVATVPVTLVPVPTVATLEISGGTPDAEVFLDGAFTMLGKVSATGEFTNKQVPIGTHRIQLRKSDFEDGPSIPVEFSAGETKSISGPQVQLKPYGWIEFKVEPPGSDITYTLNGAAGSARAKSGDQPRLKAGRYRITVSAPDRQAYIDPSFEVESGKGKLFTKTLETIDRPSLPPPPPATYGMDIVSDATAPTPFRLATPPRAGTYSFKIKLRRSTFISAKRARWVLNFVDTRNYIEYEIDEKNLKYIVHQNGAERSSRPVPHMLGNPDNQDFYSLSVGVSGTMINVLGPSGKAINIETPPGVGNFLAGRFGFSKDEIFESFNLVPAR